MKTPSSRRHASGRLHVGLWAAIGLSLNVSLQAQVPDGLDPGANGWVSSLAVQPNGKILVGGQFTMLGGQPRTNIARLNPDGTLGPAFTPRAEGGGGGPEVLSLAVEADGKILVGGEFTILGGQPRTNIARLDADGTVDAGFNPGAEGIVYQGWLFPGVWSLAVQADGKVVVGGWFTSLGGQPRTNIARLNADGTLDAGFNPGANGAVRSLAVQTDGKILVGGRFTTLGG